MPIIVGSPGPAGSTTVAQLLLDIVSEGAFDVDPTTALRWLDRRHKMMCAGSRCYRKTESAGVTVANVGEVARPAGLVEAVEVTVGGVTFGKAKHTDIAAWTGSRLILSDSGGMFTDSADSAGDGQIVLVPPPDTSGLAVSVYGAWLPPDLSATDISPGVLRIDEDFVEGLLAGVFATGLQRPSEGRPDLAAQQEAIFQAAMEAQRRRVNRRLRGPGPSQIRVVGYNA